MFIERMNTLSAVLVPQLYCLVITGRHNHTIVWRKPAMNILEDQKKGLTPRIRLQFYQRHVSMKDVKQFRTV